MPRLVLILALLSACGADGAPEKPDAVKPGITLTGEARIGIVSE